MSAAGTSAAAAAAQSDDEADFDDIPDLRAELEQVMALEDTEAPARDEDGNQEMSMCPAGQCIFMMFRSKVFRRQQESGHFPPMRFYPRRLNLRRFPREIKRELIHLHSIKARNSPSRCVELGKRLGILPIEICDFHLNRRYPQLKHAMQAEELRRERAKANNEPDRLFLFNVFAGFKLSVTFREQEAPAPGAQVQLAQEAAAPDAAAPEVPPQPRNQPVRRRRRRRQ